jgi:hypothetical protein
MIFNCLVMRPQANSNSQRELRCQFLDDHYRQLWLLCDEVRQEWMQARGAALPCEAPALQWS